MGIEEEFGGQWTTEQGKHGLEADRGIFSTQQDAALFTSRSTPVLLADTPLLRPGSVRERTTQAHTRPPPPIPGRRIPIRPTDPRLGGNENTGMLTCRHKNRQLVREGQAQKDHRYRPHAIPLHHLPALQERLPDRHPQGRPRPREGIEDLGTDQVTGGQSRFGNDNAVK